MPRPERRRREVAGSGTGCVARSPSNSNIDSPVKAASPVFVPPRFSTCRPVRLPLLTLEIVKLKLAFAGRIKFGTRLPPVKVAGKFSKTKAVAPVPNARRDEVEN